jgi:dolichol-phosphate mannosyltransferase
MPPSIDPNSASQQTVHVSENARPGPELAIVIPTFNERDNIKELLDRLETTLEGCHWEAIFVDDDSPDRTSDVVREIAGRDHRIRTIRRIGRRGLSTACIEGMLSSSAPYLAVMDGDLQHDEKLLPEMLAALRANRADIVIGSRYTSGGGVGTWSESRATLSRLATRLSRFVVKEKLTDPMSGFFVIRNEAFRGAVRNLSGVGFKILLDLFASSPTPLRFEEMPYEFRNRQAGESKLDNQVAWEYGMLLLDKLVGHILPVRFVAFTLVGAVGIGVHLIVQGILFAGLNRGFVTSQAAATLVAMTFNFALNNVLTYRDMRLRGWQWLRGWASFTIACSVGAFANVGIAAYIFSLDTQWVLAAICGIVVGAVWNYAVTMVYTWKKPRDSR